MRNGLNKADEITRRRFMANVAKTCLGVGTMPWLSSNSAFGLELFNGAKQSGRPTARNVIYLYMAGGMSQMDTLDPKPDSEFKGPVKTIGTNVDGIRLSENLPLLAMEMDKAAVVRSLTSTQGAHEQGNYFMHTSYAQRGTIQHPGMGSWIMRLSGRSNPDMPGSVSIGNSRGTAGFLGAKFAPLHVGNPEQGLQFTKRLSGVNEQEFQERLDLSKLMDLKFHKKYEMPAIKDYDEVYDDALRLMKSEDLKAFDLSNEPVKLRNAYGRDGFGQGCLLARRLVENNVRFVEVTLGGWDTHSDNFDAVAERCFILDQALSTLLNDLEVRGLLDETLVVLATEFGRTPNINANDGRDHFPKAFSCMLAGGGIQGGQILGETDKDGGHIVSDKVQVPDFNATIAYALGLPLQETIYSPSGRPFKVAHDGAPLTALF